MRGHRRACDVMSALSMLNASFGRPSSSLQEGDCNDVTSGALFG